MSSVLRVTWEKCFVFDLSRRCSVCSAVAVDNLLHPIHFFIKNLFSSATPPLPVSFPPILFTEVPLFSNQNNKLSDSLRRVRIRLSLIEPGCCQTLIIHKKIYRLLSVGHLHGIVILLGI